MTYEQLETRVQQLEMQLRIQADQTAALNELVAKQTQMLNKHDDSLDAHLKVLKLLNEALVGILSADQRKVYGGLIQ